MKCLESILAPVSPSLLVLVLALVGCSDDGLAPGVETDAGSTAGSGNATSGEAGSSPVTTGPQEEGTGTGPSEDSTGEPGTTGTDDGTGDGETTGGTPTMTCEMPGDCVLINDCCQCAAAHVDDEIPECPMECIQPMCDALGIPGIGVVCADGQCELEERDCSGVVACDALPPDCPDGTLPEVGPGGGGCWTGACIPVEGCELVPGCEHCNDGEACVETTTQQATTYSCQDVPDDCDGVPTCACMPADTCTMPFDVCADADGLIQCSCPMC